MIMMAIDLFLFCFRMMTKMTIVLRERTRDGVDLGAVGVVGVAFVEIAMREAAAVLGADAVAAKIGVNIGIAMATEVVAEVAGAVLEAVVAVEAVSMTENPGAEMMVMSRIETVQGNHGVTVNTEGEVEAVLEAVEAALIKEGLSIARHHPKIKKLNSTINDENCI